MNENRKVIDSIKLENVRIGKAIAIPEDQTGVETLQLRLQPDESSSSLAKHILHYIPSQGQILSGLRSRITQIYCELETVNLCTILVHSAYSECLLEDLSAT